jgi:hypothetical protein
VSSLVKHHDQHATRLCLAAMRQVNMTRRNSVTEHGQAFDGSQGN